MVKIAVPSDTLSPGLTKISLIKPAKGDGISMVALSDSSVISESSALTASPALIRISITGTSLKSPISGIKTFFNSATCFPQIAPLERDNNARIRLKRLMFFRAFTLNSAYRGIRFLRVNAIFLYGVRNLFI